MENFINISVMGHDFYKYKYQRIIRNKTKVKYQKKQNPNAKYQRKESSKPNVKRNKSI
jgi:hypothetical protein